MKTLIKGLGIVVALILVFGFISNSTEDKTTVVSATGSYCVIESEVDGKELEVLYSVDTGEVLSMSFDGNDYEVELKTE